MSTLAECRRPYIEVVLDPDWEPTWFQSPGYKTTCWITDNPYPNATFERSHVREEPSELWIDGKARPIAPRISEGRIYFRCLKDDAAQRRLAAKAIRLIGKIATNKNMQEIRYPSL
ncbi:MAG: hypothetical protein H7840_16850, partial [Alphaproteobacteria bacterium]